MLNQELMFYPRQCAEPDCGITLLCREGFYVDLCSLHNKEKKYLLEVTDLARKLSRCEISADAAWEKFVP